MSVVKFTEVGRNKRSWEAKCPHEVDCKWLCRQVKSNAMVGSNDLAFCDDGMICAGMHVIGRFEIIEGGV